ncbi:MAG: hypothetical protein SPG58_06870 [Collinsella sp.]|nr:hypothetical protein [Collinsella sp.]
MRAALLHGDERVITRLRHAGQMGVFVHDLFHANQRFYELLIDVLKRLAA